MELDFDKEIDALLRRAGKEGNPASGTAGPVHLDADEISAFAENALPERTRAVYMRHLADCDRCRKILSQSIPSGSEPDAKAASSVVAAPSVVARIPWYRRIFLMPNLAYVMGGLVLVFAGFLGYSVLRDSDGSRSAEVSQVADEQRPAGGPSAAEGPAFETSGIAAENTSANTNTTANRVTTGATAVSTNSSVATLANTANSNAATTGSSPSITVDGLEPKSAGVAAERPSVTSADTAAAPLAKPLPLQDRKPARDEEQKKDEAKTKEERAAVTENEQARTDTGVVMKTAPSAKSVSGLRAAGPSRQMNNQQQQQLNNLPGAVQENRVSPARLVGGKAFRQNQGVWYDTAYQGQRTINVGRSTDKYKKLDAGLRAIAEGLAGAIVVVWKEKAYRIQ